MTGLPGKDFILYDGTGTGTVAIAAQRVTSFTLNGQAVDVTNKDSTGMWRELLASAGVVSLDVSAEGVLGTGTLEEILAQRVINRSNDPYTLKFKGDNNFAGAFRLTQIDEAGNHDGEQTYKLALQSAGSIAYGTT